MEAAEKLKTLVRNENWQGTMSDLALALDRTPESAPHFAIWLRRHEPILWWTYGICVRFSRTGKRRLVHLGVVMQFPTRRQRGDGDNVSFAVTPVG